MNSLLLDLLTTNVNITIQYLIFEDENIGTLIRGEGSLFVIIVVYPGVMGGG